MTVPRYVFTRVPNNDEGRKLVETMRKYLNKDKYKLRVRGQGLIKGENWRKYTRGAPLNKSTHLRIYVELKEVVPVTKEYHVRVRKEYVGYYNVRAENLREAEIKAESLLSYETDDEVCPSVDFEEFNPKEF